MDGLAVLDLFRVGEVARHPREHPPIRSKRISVNVWLRALESEPETKWSDLIGRDGGRTEILLERMDVHISLDHGADRMPPKVRFLEFHDGEPLLHRWRDRSQRRVGRGRSNHKHAHFGSIETYRRNVCTI